MPQFTPEEIKSWFMWVGVKPMESDAEHVRSFLARGFDPDQRDELGRSGLYRASQVKNHPVVPLLVEALQKKYASDPKALIKALCDGQGGQTPAKEFHMDVKFFSLDTKEESAASANIIDNAHRAVAYQILDPDYWFAAIEGNLECHAWIYNYAHLTAAGFDPDMRDDKGRSGLERLAALDKSHQARALVKALQAKYGDYPDKLIEALEAGSPEQKFIEHAKSSTTKYSQEAAEAIHKALEDARRAQAAIDRDMPIARHTKPKPIKTDRTLTFVRLLDKKPNGKTNLQIFAEQGQLPDVFTADIWQGRREEMDRAWSQVPERYKNQVDIESIRAQVGADESRARFRRDDGEKGQGF